MYVILDLGYRLHKSDNYNLDKTLLTYVIPQSVSEVHSRL